MNEKVMGVCRDFRHTLFFFVVFPEAIMSVIKCMMRNIDIQVF